ncbi:MAG: serine hydrolase [Pirellulaceae bacterium]
MPQLLHDFAVPGAALAIIDNGEIVLQKGYGFADVENEVQVTTKTGFNIGSISKCFAAWGIMKLVEEGKLDLDAPAEQYLSRWQFPESDFDSKEVTIRRMLSHTAGLSLHGYPGWSPDDELPTIEESLNGKNNGAPRVEIIMEPGTQYKYSGGGYTVMQLIIEEVTGQKFEDYMQAEILEPLGMTSSSFKIDDKIMAASASSYDKFAEPTDFELFTAQAAAGFHTTIEDFTRFALANLYGHENFGQHNPVLPGETLQQMMQASPQAEGRYGYGMGYFAESLPEKAIAMAGHRGANTGWHAIFTVNPETNDGFVMITNGGSGHQVYSPILYDWTLWQTGVTLEDWHNAKPPVSKRLKAHIDRNGLDGMAALYAELKENQAEAQQSTDTCCFMELDFAESQLNDLGYYYMSKDDLEKALAVFKLNVEAFPNAANVYDSYGEALLKQGSREEAIANYQRSVELDPFNEGGIKVLNDLGVATRYSVPFAPEQATGAPNTFVAGDLPTAWSTLEEDTGEEWLKLTYDQAVEVGQIRVHETCTPGAITRITAETNDGEVVIWSGDSVAAEAPYWRELIPTVTAQTDNITIHLDTTIQKGWNEIDAVELVGTDGSRQWAVKAEASTYFGQNNPGPLQLGRQGPGVSALQTALNSTMDPSPGLAVDGMFGPATDAAVKQLQQQAEIEVDGIAGRETVAALAALGADVDPYFVESMGELSNTGPRVITRNVLQDSDGLFWLATWHGVMSYDPSAALRPGSNTFTNLTNKDNLRRFRAFSLLEDHEENIWVGTVGAGVYRYNPSGSGTWTNFTTEDGLVGDSIVTMMQDSDNNIWIGAEGVTKYDPGSNTFNSFNEDDGFTSSDVNSISQAPDGTIWFGTRGALFQYDGETFVNFSEQHGLNFPGYVPTVIDRQGHLWFGGENGVYHYDGETLQHLFPHASYSLFEDSRGNIWFSGGALKGQDAPESGTVILNRFDPASGLENILDAREQFEIENGAIFGITEDQDGHIWFGTGRGIGRIDGDTVQYY